MSRSPDLAGNRSLIDTVRDIRRPRPLPETGWVHVGTSNPALGGDIAPAFENSWENAEDGAPPASFYLAPDGEVRLRGVIQSGTAPSVAFTLPEGYRPEYDMTFIVPQVSEDEKVAKIVVSIDGSVTVLFME